MIDPIELKPQSKASLYKVIRMPVGSRKQVVFRLTDEAGAPVDLNAEPKNEPAETPTFDYQKPITSMTVSVRLVAKDQYSSHQKVLDLTGKILDDGDCKGLVEFELSGDAVQRAGVFLCEVGRFVESGVLIDTWPVYLAIEPSVFQTMSGSGPLTIPEVRLGLDDLSPGDISLLDEVEFEDVQILYAIRQIVDLWNETPPPVATYTTHTFPFRYHWIKGTMAKLYAIAAKKYLRNQLNYQAGGITIDDQNKYQQYMEFSKALMDEFNEWMMREKLRQNIERAYYIGL